MTRISPPPSIKSTAAAGGGKILQAVSYSDTTTINTSSATLVDMTSVTVTLTTSANSKLLIMFSANIAHGTTTTSRVQLSPNLDSSSLFSTYTAFAKADTGGNGGVATINYLTAAQTAASHTVKIQWASIDTGTIYSSFKSLVVLEVSA